MAESHDPTGPASFPAPAVDTEPPARASAAPPYRPDVNDAPRAPWSRLQRVVFRFAFAYFVIYSALFVAGQVPLQYLSESAQKRVTDAVFTPWMHLEDGVVKWVGANVLHVNVTVGPNGSGDTTWNYVQVAIDAALALAITLVWTLLDEFVRARAGWGPGHQRRLRDGWRVWLRFVLGLTLISYGCAKVIPSQMPAPGLDRLSQPFGEASPMGLLWTFLGASKGYEIFSGLAELVAGWLLVTRRTTTIGALMAMAVMGNVAALNFFYDVPVKLYSSHLFLMAAALVVPEWRRLARIFVLNRAAPPAELGRLFPWKPANVAASVLCLLVFGHATWQSLRQSRQYYLQYSEGPPSPIWGSWVVTNFELDGAPAVGSEDEAWRRLVVGNVYRLSLETVKDPFRRYFTKLDEKSRKLTLSRRDAPTWSATLGYELPDKDKLQLEGKFDGHDVFAEFKRSSVSEFLLLRRGFRWVNEFPDNE